MATRKSKKMYRTKDVLNLFGLKAERLRKWIDIYFGFSFEKAVGTGSTHRFRRHHLYIIGLFLQLVDSGLNRQEASNLVMSIDEKRWERIRKQERDCFIFITPDPKIKYENMGETRPRIRDRKMILQFIPGTKLDLSGLNKDMGLNPIWLTNLYNIVKFVDSNLSG